MKQIKPTFLKVGSLTLILFTIRTRKREQDTAKIWKQEGDDRKIKGPKKFIQNLYIHHWRHDCCFSGTSKEFNFGI